MEAGLAIHSHARKLIPLAANAAIIVDYEKIELMFCWRMPFESAASSCWRGIRAVKSN